MPSTISSRSARILGLAGVVALACCGGNLSIGSDLQEQPAKVASDAGGAAPSIDGGATSVDVGGRDGAIDIDAGPGNVGPLGTVLCQWGMPEEDGGIPPGVTTKTYNRGCAQASDCAIGQHLADCCGSYVALGVRANQASRFSAAGGICGAEQPACDCAGRPMRADDGQYSEFADGRDIVVACSSGVCQTKVSTFACGSTRCDSKTQFCEVQEPGIAFGDGGTPPNSYTCSPLPSGCAAAPTCACVTPTTSNVRTCTDGSGGVIVTHWGV